MRRIATFVIGWCVAAVVAVAVAWQGVGVVADRVTEARPQPLDLAEIAAEAAAGITAVPTTLAPMATTGAVVPPPAGPSPTATTTVPAAAPDGEIRSYNVRGGAAALQFSPTGVSVLWANPNPGFEVRVQEARGTGVRVLFRGEDHRSEVEAWWEAGPNDQVRDDPH